MDLGYEIWVEAGDALALYWDIVERSQLGISSSRHQPGPHSARESIPAAWDREYLRWIGVTLPR